MREEGKKKEKKKVRRRKSKDRNEKKNKTKLVEKDERTLVSERKETRRRK